MTPEHIQALDAIQQSAWGNEVVRLPYSEGAEAWLKDWATYESEKADCTVFRGRDEESELPWIVVLERNSEAQPVSVTTDVTPASALSESGKSANRDG
jgi:hypothetical protein